MALGGLFVKPQKFLDAIRALGKKKRIAKKLSSKQWAKIPAQIRQRAYFTSNVESIKFLSRSKKMLSEYLAGAREYVTRPDGTRVVALKKNARADFIFEMQRLAKQEGLGDILPPGLDMSRDMITRMKDVASESRLKLIFDTQTQQAQAYGYYKQGQDPAILDAYPAQRFIRAEQRKVPRPLHQQNRNEVRRKDDMDFWLRMNDESIGGLGVPFGPWGFNSGMDVEDVSRKDAIRMGLIGDNESVLPPDDTFNKGVKAAAKDVPTEFLNKFLEKLDMDAVTTGDFIQLIEHYSDAPAQERAKPVPVPKPKVVKTSALERYERQKKEVNAMLKGFHNLEKEVKKAEKASEKAWMVRRNYEDEYKMLNDLEELKKAQNLTSEQEKYLQKNRSKFTKKGLEKLEKQQDKIAIREEKLREKWVSSDEKLFNKIATKGEDAASVALTPRWKNGKPRGKKLPGDLQAGVDGFNQLTGRIQAEAIRGIEQDRFGENAHSLLESNAITFLPETEVVRGKRIKSRAFSRQKSGIFVRKSAKPRTVVHELGHQLEGRHPKIKKMATEWLEKRIENGKRIITEKMNAASDAGKHNMAREYERKLQKYQLRKLRDITKNDFYGNDELAYEDDFLSPYIGKKYKWGSTEVVSMGMEWMFQDPVSFHRKDPGHFDLILRIINAVFDVERDEYPESLKQ